MANHAIGQIPGAKGGPKRDSVENDRSVSATAAAAAKAAGSGGAVARQE